jgi:uncharacterized protein YukE
VPPEGSDDRVAETFDVASRLAEGRPAVDNIQTLVWACHQLGYQNPDLTSHAAQVRELYGGEDGLDLRALDADSAALGRAAEATQEALVRQDEQLAALSDAWQGGAADTSRAFLRRHADASATAVEAVHAAVDALAALRDELWRAVDGKVSAAVAIDGRTQAQHAEWLAAAQTVTNGAGDRAAASELIDQQVKPFVDNDIHGEWLTAMRSATASVADAYDAATTKLTSLPDAVFDVPGGLGPSWIPALRDDGDDVVATAPAAASAPAVSAPPVWNQAPAWGGPPEPQAMPGPIAPPLSAPLPTAPPPEPAAAVPAAAMPSAPSLGGLPDVGGGLSGFGQQLADMLGGLMGSDDALPEPPDLGDPADLDDPPDLDDPAELDETDSDEADDETDDDETDADEQAEVDAPGETLAGTAEADETSDTCDMPPAEPPPALDPPPSTADPASTPVPEPPAAPPPLPAPEPLSAVTPCEIAADELPQVGE